MGYLTEFIEEENEITSKSYQCILDLMQSDEFILRRSHRKMHELPLTNHEAI